MKKILDLYPEQIFSLVIFISFFTVSVPLLAKFLLVIQKFIFPTHYTFSEAYLGVIIGFIALFILIFFYVVKNKKAQT